MQRNSATPFLQRFPRSRLRRPRAEAWSRDLHAEISLNPQDLIWAIVIKEGNSEEEPIEAMPGVFRLTIDRAVAAAARARELGIPALALFPYTETADRDPTGRRALDPENLMCRAARAIKDAVPEIGLAADVALDPYTDHGHDGVMIDDEIANDETVAILARQAVLEAAAGFDIVAPSDMMDGRIGVIRDALDDAGLKNTMIISYAAKYASGFYGPYRDAIGSAGVLRGDKKTYQMNPANADEALRETAMDLEEGADGVMVKPAGAYLDIIHRVKSTFAAPTFAFQVSGEYAMIEAAARNGWIDGDAAVLESLIAIKRAGADGILTYYAERAAKLLQNTR